MVARLLNLIAKGLLLGGLSCLAWTQEQRPADEYNLPPEINSCLRKIANVHPSGKQNPFYLSADFDADRKLDFAVWVTKGVSEGILFCLSSRTNPLLFEGRSEAGKPTKAFRFDAWFVVPKENEMAPRVGGSRRDALHLDVKETADGVLYWDGRQFGWIQQGD